MPKDAASATATASAARTLAAEITGLEALAGALTNGMGEPFKAAVDLIAGIQGRVVVTGMGKSGHIARKIAATLASTGTPALFLHPAEASHGDLGMIARGDVVLALSWSGDTSELRDVVNYCTRFDIPLIGMASVAASALTTASTIPLVLPKAEEACPNRLAPTTSTTMQLALGDALAVALLEGRGFSASDFKNFHPGGRLGARLIAVADLMTGGADFPHIGETGSIGEAIAQMSRQRPQGGGVWGCVGVIGPRGELVGVFTDGDLRRSLPIADLTAPIAPLMHGSPSFVTPATLATEAVRVMNERPNPITVIFVCEGEKAVGALHLHDLLRAGVA